AENFRIRWRWRWRGLAAFDFLFAEAVKLVGLFQRWRVAFAFLGKNVEQDGFILRFQKLKCPDEQRNVVSIDRPVIAQAELLENDTRYEQAFDALLNFMRKLCDRFSSNRLDKMTRFLMKVRERRAGHDGVQVICNRADIFGDRPLVVIQDDDEPLRVRFDVIKRFVTDSARKRSVACDDHDILVAATQVASDGHAESCGQGGSCVTRAVAIVLAFGAQQKAIKPAELTHGAKSVEPAGKHFVHIALVTDVHHKAVLGRFENTM